MRVSVSSLANPSIALSVTLIAVGCSLFAIGLDRWRYVAWVADTGASRSPAPFGAKFSGWAPVVQREIGSRRWYVVTVGPKSRDELCTVAEQLGDPALTGAIAILNVVAPGEGERSTATCRTTRDTRATADVAVLSREPRELGSGSDKMLSRGFLFLDSTFHVVYGSYSLGDLNRVPSAVRLFGAGN
jgi:hypothetical protein